MEPLPWTEAVRDPASADRARFLESHIDLVKYLASRMASRLPASVEIEDLVNDGVLGLLDAVEKYDGQRGVRFRTYAESRIRGAILDGLRKKDWRPRSVRHLRRRLDETMNRLASTLRRAPTEDEIAAAMELDLPAYRSLLKDSATGPLLSLEDLPPGSDPAETDDSCQPHNQLERRDLLVALAEEVVRIPERERRVLELYYHEGLNMKEVGAVLGITESRVCQLHSQAASRLRTALRKRTRIALLTVDASRAGRRR